MPDTDNAPRSMSVEQAMELAVSAIKLNQTDTARTIFQGILRAIPDHADACHFLGVLHVREGDAASAIPLMERSLVLAPSMVEWRNNLGNAYQRAGRHLDAIDQYRLTLDSRPEDSNAWSNLGNSLRMLDRFKEAEAAFQKALEFQPDHIEALINFAKLLATCKRFEEARQPLIRVVELDPNKSAAARELLYRVLMAHGERERAVQALRDWQEAVPENPRPRHFLAALSGENVPERAEDAYVTETFDEFAESFEANLTILGYRAPPLVADALTKALGAASGRFRGLDAGCGTGWCGPLVRAHFDRLDGVDLSAGMMAVAQKRNAYDELALGELTAFIASRPATYDAIISADTLCYFGVLGPVLAAARGSLLPGGVLVFTLEQDLKAEAGPGYRLQKHGRYCHREEYVRDSLAQAGAIQVDIDHETLRQEDGEPVHGLVVSARWPGKPGAFSSEVVSGLREENATKTNG